MIGSVIVPRIAAPETFRFIAAEAAQIAAGATTAMRTAADVGHGGAGRARTETWEKMMGHYSRKGGRKENALNL